MKKNDKEKKKQEMMEDLKKELEEKLKQEREKNKDTIDEEENEVVKELEQMIEYVSSYKPKNKFFFEMKMNLISLVSRFIISSLLLALFYSNINFNNQFLSNKYNIFIVIGIISLYFAVLFIIYNKILKITKYKTTAMVLGYIINLIVMVLLNEYLNIFLNNILLCIYLILSSFVYYIIVIWIVRRKTMKGRRI